MGDGGPIRDDAAPASPEAEEAARVEAWLRARPRFLAERPWMYDVLDPPRRAHGDGVADHMEARIARADARAEALGRALDLDRWFGDCVHRAVHALQEARAARADPCEAIAECWPAFLGLDAAHVACEGPPARHRLPIPPGTAARLVPPGQDYVVRLDPGPDPALHGEAAPLVARDALLRLPGPRLVVLLCRDPRRLPERGVSRHLRYLARAAAAALAA